MFKVQSSKFKVEQFGVPRLRGPIVCHLFEGIKAAYFTAVNLEQAVRNTKECCDKMNSRYGKVVFDEWVILSFSGDKETILAYSGPRREHFKQNFDIDSKVLRNELRRNKYHIGDFEFAREGTGTHFDTFIMLGKDLFLICNSTNLSMSEIARNPNWIMAQVPFVELTDLVRADPLVA
ncbi:MAG: hypothetical protein ACK4UN_01730 [Limisphaerales bacterium]